MGVFHLTPQQMAIYTGCSLHEVAHVVGASNAMDPTGNLHLADQATITKMIRVMMLAPVLVIMSFILNRTRKQSSLSNNRTITIPWFAFGFILVIVINSILGTFIAQNILSNGREFINGIDNFLLTMAMTALGAETSIGKFKQAGAKPFYLAAIIYIWLICGGYFLCKFMVSPA